MHDDADAVAGQIVEAASGYFLRFGYSRVSTEEIARSIGRSKKTMYKHFPSKEELLRAVLERLDGQLRQEVAGLLAAGGDRLELLRRTLTTVALRMSATHRVLLVDLRATSPELGQKVWAERRQALGRLLGPVLREAVADGSLRADLEVEQVLAVYFSCVEGMSCPGDGAQGADGLFGPLISLLVDGLRRR